MSGTGKSTILEIFGTRGHRTVDTDTDRWSHWVTLPDGSSAWIWREQAIADLLASHHAGSLFVAGCKSNQGKFYCQFHHIVLLSAPADVLLARIASRTNNPTASGPKNEPPSLSTSPSSNHSCGPPPPSRSTPRHRSTRLLSRSKASPDPGGTPASAPSRSTHRNRGAMGRADGGSAAGGGPSAQGAAAPSHGGPANETRQSSGTGLTLQSIGDRHRHASSCVVLAGCAPRRA